MIDIKKGTKNSLYFNVGSVVIVIALWFAEGLIGVAIAVGFMMCIAALRDDLVYEINNARKRRSD